MVRLISVVKLLCWMLCVVGVWLIDICLLICIGVGCWNVYSCELMNVLVIVGVSS